MEPVVTTQSVIREKMVYRPSLNQYGVSTLQSDIPRQQHLLAYVAG
jgi:hypothetical protein